MHRKKNITYLLRSDDILWNWPENNFAVSVHATILYDEFDNLTLKYSHIPQELLCTGVDCQRY